MRLAGISVSSHLLPVFVLGLAAVLLFACGFAMWTLTSATSSAAGRLRSELATQAAGVFPPAAPPQPAEPEPPAEPTPWPTFTPQPQPAESPEPANPTPNATQSAIIEKLLSEGCSNALETLRNLSEQAKSNPTVAFDAQWRDNLSQAVADMKTNCGTLDAASPVPGLISQAHQDLSRAQSEFDQAGRLFDEGVRDLAPGKLLEAAQHVQQAVRYLNQAITELRKIGND